MLQDLLVIAEENPFDIILTTGNGLNGPESVPLYGGLSISSKPKIFLVFDGWGAMGSAFGENKGNMEKIDGIFCEDELAKSLITRYLPEFSKDRIYTTGVFDAQFLGLDRADFYKDQFRKDFEIDSNALVVAHLTTIASAFQGVGADPQMEQSAFDISLRAVEKFLDNHGNGGKKVVVALKAHPRDPQPDGYKNIFAKYEKNSNMELKIIPTSYDINKLAYGADLITGTLSSELFLAPLRGRQAVFLGYDGSGLGGGVLKKVYGEEVLKVISERPATSIVSSSEEFTACLEDFDFSGKKSDAGVNDKDSTKRILDIILEK